MSINPCELGSIPEETARIAHAACRKGTLAMHLRDALEELCRDEHFADLDPVEEETTYALWRLTLVTVLQYIEDLTDHQAVEATVGRIDWKYALGLELTDLGFDITLLPAFRARLLERPAECQLLERLMEVCKQRRWLGRKYRQSIDAVHVLAKVGSLPNQSSGGGWTEMGFA